MATFSAAAGFAEDNIPFELKRVSHENSFYRAFEFSTDEFYTYTIQNSSNGVVWNEITTFHGFNEPALYPFAFLPTTTQSSGPTLLDSSTPITLSLKRAVEGGTIMTWRSLVDGTPKRIHVASINLGTHWDNAPFFHYITDQYNYFVDSPTGADLPVPASQSVLVNLDQWFKNHFISTDFQTLDTKFQNYSGSNNLLLPTSNGGNAFYRVIADIADEDFDGLIDMTEQTDRNQGGTETDHQDPDTDDDGFWDGAEEAQGTDSNNAQSKPDNAPTTPDDADNDDGNGPPGTGSVIQVGFRGNHRLVSDNLKTRYVDPHWKVDSHNYPISYARTQSVVLTAKFFIAPPADNISTQYDVSAVLPNEVFLHKSELFHEGGNIYALRRTVCKGPIPAGGDEDEAPAKSIADTIKWYSAQEEGGEYRIQWTIYANDVPSNAGTTKHTMYVTDGIPGDSQRSSPFEIQNLDDIRQESIFFHACKLSYGQVSSDEASKVDIANLLYQEFRDQKFHKVKPTQGLLETDVSKALGYWGDINMDGLPDDATCLTGRRLLLESNGNGTCQAWASLFSDILNAHNFGSKIVQIKPKPPHQLLLVKKAEEFIEPTDDVVGYNWRLYIPTEKLPQGEPSSGHLKYLKKNIPIGVPAQGKERFPNSDPEKRFNVHYVTSLGNTWYDPSYGSNKISNDNEILRAKFYENMSIGWYGQEVSDHNLWFKKNRLDGDAEITWKNTE